MTNLPLCRCECGQPVALAKQTIRKFGMVKGEPLKFLPHHSLKGAAHHKFNNYRSTTSSGYRTCYLPAHPRADKKGYVLEHVLLVGKIMRSPINSPHCIHHVNGNRADNRPGNLVLCEDQEYHLLLHTRQRALEACGHADWLKCPYCKQHSPPDELWISPDGKQRHHRSCINQRHQSQRMNQHRVLTETHAQPSS